MKLSTVAIIMLLIFGGCKKDKFTTAPQITYKKVSPDVFLQNNLNPNEGPVVTFNLKDGEGDFGPLTDKDTSYIYVKNITIAPFVTDSFTFPNLGNQTSKNLNADVDVLIRDVLRNSGGPVRPYTDTLFFEIFVKDFAKNKSNVIVAGPVYYITP